MSKPIRWEDYEAVVDERDELRAERDQDFTRGVIAARERYTRAWVEATGEPLEAVQFTTGFLKEHVELLQQAVTSYQEQMIVQEARIEELWGDLQHALAIDEAGLT